MAEIIDFGQKDGEQKKDDEVEYITSCDCGNSFWIVNTELKFYCVLCGEEYDWDQIYQE